MKNKQLVEVENLRKLFPARGLISTRARLAGTKIYVHAVDGVNFQVRRGESLGLAGESGSGKTTIGNLLLRLEIPTEGKIVYGGNDISRLKGHELKAFRKKTQMIFQNPYQALDPRFSILNIISEPLTVHHIGSKEERIEETHKILRQVGLASERYLEKHPNELSGGERQRVAIARAIILKPEFIIADEPTSMLDASIQLGILDLISRLKEAFDLTYLVISHDLAMLRYITDRILIIYLGKIVEGGSTEEILHEPLHPYAKALISSVPIADPTHTRKRKQILGEITLASSINPPKGCRLHPRCPYAKSICTREEPQLINVKREKYVACHIVK